MLVLKHTDALINLDMHQFLKSDPVKRLDPETKYRRMQQYFSERWGPHSSLDVAKIKADLTSIREDDPGWRKYLQDFNYFVGSLESTQQRDANDAVIYGPAPAAIYSARPSSTAPVAEHIAYIIIACQQADEARDAQFPHGGPALNHKPTDAELKTILLDALAASTLRAYQTLYQQYCNRSSTEKTYQDLYNVTTSMTQSSMTEMGSSPVRSGSVHCVRLVSVRGQRGWTLRCSCLGESRSGRVIQDSLTPGSSCQCPVALYLPQETCHPLRILGA